jgi:dipeptidyl-peptidase-4
MMETAMFGTSLRCRPVAVAALLLLLNSASAAKAGEAKDAGRLTIDRIFHAGEFQPDPFGSVRWLSKQPGYTTKEPSEQVKGSHDLVRFDPASGRREVVVSARHLIPSGATSPLQIEDYSWSPDESLLLIYTNSKRVWRRNTRGDYWVFDVSSHDLHKLGGTAEPSTLLFAKFSPDGRRVAYVRDRDIYVEDLATRKVTRLTTAPSPEIINGTSDWVYEEEFDLRDGLRWSPDSSRIAFWQFDTRGVDDYYLVDNIGGLYQQLTRFKYPKTGRPNPACRIGVVNTADRPAPPQRAGPRYYPPDPDTITWLDVPGDARDHYIPRMDWAGNSKEVALQQLNRLQNTNRVLLGDAFTGRVRTALVERDRAWVDVHDHLHWLEGGKKFTWLSERDGWRRAYTASRSGEQVKAITPEGIDVIDVAKVDEKNGWLYYLASPENATQRYLYRVRLDGGTAQQVTPAKPKGTHTYDISPDGRWAVHTFSTFDTPPVINLVSLPDHKVVRPLAENKKLHEKVKALKRRPTEFFRIDIGDGVELDGWCIKPPDFDPGKRYPVLFHVYGEPAGQTVVDRWGSSTYLWHRMLAQEGYVVLSVDNRGTPAPRGRAWRKGIYRQVGILAPQDQAAAVRALAKKWSWLDPGRVGVWGWSGGGSMSLNAIFRYPDLYHTAMAVAPVANQRYYDTIYQERYMGLPQDNPAGYRDGSPITHAHRLKGNLLIVHGTADDNVHYANTEALVNELIAANKQFAMMAYPNRSHGIHEGTNTRRHLFTLLTRYLRQNLPPGPKNR